MEFNPNTGISSLVLTEQAQDGCIQRTGRAGRISKGDCYRLYSEENFNQRRKFHLPEIQRSDLAGVVLTMKQMGIEEVETFEFLDPPEKRKLDQAVWTLKKLGALDGDEKITKLGKEMAELPLEPHLARMVVEAKKFGCEAEVATVVAFLGLKPVFLRFDKERESDNYWLADRAQGYFKDLNSDFLTLLNVWREYEKNGFDNEWARDNYLNPRVLREVRQVRSQLFGILGINRYVEKDVSDELIERSVAMGLVENLAENSFSRRGYIKVDNTGNYFVHPSSCLFSSYSQYITVAKVVESTKVYGSFVQRVKPEWIAEMVPDMVRSSVTEPVFNFNDGVVEQEQIFSWKNGNVYLKDSLVVNDERAVGILAEALVERNFGRVFMENTELVWETRKFYARSGGDAAFDFKESDLVPIYKKMLGNVTSIGEMKIAMAEGRLDMRLRMSDLISEELMRKVMKENPDELKIGGEIYQVEYSQIGFPGNKTFTVDIKVPATKVFENLRLPDMVSGRLARVILMAGDGLGRDTFYTYDIVGMRREARKILINDRWEKLTNNESFKNKLRMVINFKKGQETVDLPEGIEYGIDPETGERLVSVPVIVREYDENYGGERYFIKHFLNRDKAEANKVTVRSEVDLPKKTVSQPISTRPWYERQIYGGRETKPTSLQLVRSAGVDEILDEVTLLRERKGGKPRRKALLMAELAMRDLDLVGSLNLKDGDFTDILIELDGAKLEAKNKFNREEEEILNKMFKTVASSRAVLKATKSEAVKDYIGDDPESVRDFQRRLMALVEKRKEEPKGDELDGLVSDVIEAMTS